MPGQRRGAKDQEVELNDDFLNLTFATSTTLDKYNHLSFTSPSPRSNSGSSRKGKKERIASFLPSVGRQSRRG